MGVKESFKSDLLRNGLGNPHPHQVVWQIVKEGNVNIPPDDKPIPQLTQQPHQSGYSPMLWIFSKLTIAFLLEVFLPIKVLVQYHFLRITPLVVEVSWN
jgi:hypothetical protein